MNQPGEEEGQWDLLNVHRYVVGGNKGDGARLSSVLCSDSTRGNKHKLIGKCFQLNRGKNIHCYGN